jgi:uncharacterized glyoxalase superfamily protein PhnB
MYKPSGHNAVSPYLIVADAEAELAFVKAVFGVEPILLIRRQDGSVMHAEVKIDDSVVMIGQGDGPAAHVHIYLADAEAAVERALAAGATLIQPIEEKGDGDRRGGVRDPCGTHWWLARLADGGRSRSRGR